MVLRFAAQIPSPRTGWLFAVFSMWLGGSWSSTGGSHGLRAADYFLTIGGGYEPTANQASLEANVLFFHEVLAEKHRGPRTQVTFFADGFDPEPDLQVLVPAKSRPNDGEPDKAQADQPVTELLEQLFNFRDEPAVEYRNHRIPNISGANSPASIRASLERLCRSMSAKDRLFVYVTAHGAEAKGRNRYNTSISCWDEQAITAREFADWLDQVPESVPVILVMAQCYCGGFAHTIFRDVDRTRGLATRLRVGFFAQQHDLPAAGCRPDIENDEEYSSFFWGAFVGRSRTGKQMSSADFDGDQRISLAEAHAHALLTSQTIDIPLRSSEALLRTYSRIQGYDHRRDVEPRATATPDATPADSADTPLESMVGTAREIIRGATPELHQTVVGLFEQLEISLDDEIPSLFMHFEELRDRSRQLQRESSRNRRRSGRRELRSEIGDRWPELANRNWRQADILKTSGQVELLHDIQQLPSYDRYRQNLLDRESSTAALQQIELREVKFQRVINTLEAIVLTKNLPKLASSDVVEHYQRMIALENATLTSTSRQP